MISAGLPCQIRRSNEMEVPPLEIHRTSRWWSYKCATTDAPGDGPFVLKRSTTPSQRVSQELTLLSEFTFGGHLLARATCRSRCC